ncbi:MAG: sigma 54-interacting transcriptional regulator [Nitrospirales bacterium]|nr:sigma 54-interacting transcriptional regulator [Nitrospira sp.]MDR4499837.1 sigma 54-interacting transcriptional regulator [Nitrospirales bacterium]
MLNDSSSLYDAELRFRAVAQSSSDAIIIGDGRGTILYWNSGAERVFGYQSDEVVGQSLTMLMPERYRLSHQQGIARYCQTGKMHLIGTTSELYGLRKSGEEFPLELTLSSWKEHHQQFFSGIIRDISKRRAAEDALRQSEEKYRAIFNQAIEGIYQTSLDGIFLNANPALSHLLGYGSSSDLIKSVSRIGVQLYVHPERRQQFCQLVEQMDIVTEFESQVYRRDGTVIWISENARVVRDAQGVTQWYEGSAVDISARKQAEELLETKNRLEAENLYLQEEVIEACAFGDLIGHSPALENVIRQVDLVARTDATVLILGESGTGKELVAREIHKRSRRHARPLIRVNCASIPKELYESEFFGHVKGAFTGAVKGRAGRFEAADGGTLFLDEVGEIPLDVQSKFLRVLQEQQYERVGDERTRTVDVRVIAATNRDLKKEVDIGRFRQDLYYRLNVFPIEITPLRYRQEDIPLLADHFLDIESKKLHCARPLLTPQHVSILQGYHWPGNVRELQNIIERALITSRSGELYFELPIKSKRRGSTQGYPRPETVEILSEKELQRLIRRNTLTALKQTRWKVYGSGGAAELLGIKPTTLVARMKKMQLDKQHVLPSHQSGSEPQDNGS